MFNQKSVKWSFLIASVLVLAACGEVGPIPSLSASSASSSSPLSSSSSSSASNSSSTPPSSSSISSSSSSSQPPVQYTITFKNYDNSVLSTQTVTQGNTAVYTGPNPTRPSSEQYTYTFTGWDKTLTNITSSFSTTAQYSQTINYIPITNAQELNNIRNNLSGNYQLMNDVDLESNEWTPIGTDTAPFSGTLDGQGFTISNLKITTSQVYVGLIGYNQGTIKNLKLANVDINVTGGLSTDIYGGAFIGYNDSESDLNNLHTLNGDMLINKRGVNKGYAGGLIGYCATTNTISNLSNNIDITGDLFDGTGGIIGYSNESVSISNLSNAGSVTGSTLVGGLIGTTSKSISISNSFNNGSINGGARIGGLIGDAGFFGDRDVNITNSFNSGSVNGSYAYVGGLIGFLDRNVNVTNSSNSGSVNGSYAYVGGLIGFGNRNVSIINSSNRGSIDGGDNIGGLVGQGQDSFISYSFNIGFIRGVSAVGGLAGAGKVNIANSFNAGSVIGGVNVGGLIGSAHSALITSSSNNGSIGGLSSVGGLAGSSSGSVTISNSFNSGPVTGTNNDVGGLVGLSNNFTVTISYSFNIGIIVGTQQVGGLIGKLNWILNVYYSVNLGNVVATLNTTAVGGITGVLPPTNDIEQTYYSGSITSNGVEVDGVAFGTKVTDLSTFNLAFFTTTLEWDTGIWGLSGLNIANGVYPTLKNMPVVED